MPSCFVDRVGKTHFFNFKFKQSKPALLCRIAASLPRLALRKSQYLCTHVFRKRLPPGWTENHSLEVLSVLIATVLVLCKNESLGSQALRCFRTFQKHTHAMGCHKPLLALECTISVLSDTFIACTESVSACNNALWMWCWSWLAATAGRQPLASSEAATFH